MNTVVKGLSLRSIGLIQPGVIHRYYTSPLPNETSIPHPRILYCQPQDTVAKIQVERRNSITWLKGWREGNNCCSVTELPGFQCIYYPAFLQLVNIFLKFHVAFCPAAMAIPPPCLFFWWCKYNKSVTIITGPSFLARKLWSEDLKPAALQNISILF